MKFAFALVCLVLPMLAAGGEPAKLAPSRHRDLAGKDVTVPDPAAKATVLVLLSTTCPICNKYAPEIRRIAFDYGARGICLLLV